MSRKQRGPVLSGVILDDDVAAIRFGLNHPEKALPTNLHPVLRDRYIRLQKLASKRGIDPIVALGKDVAGSHSEIYALNDLLWSFGDNVYPSVLRRVSIYNVRTLKMGMALPGDPIVRCANCRFLMWGVRRLQ